jgi:hypothetical protein
MTDAGKQVAAFCLGALVGAASIMVGIILHDARHGPAAAQQEDRK